MPEERPQDPRPIAAPREDVDDLIFHAEPEWTASQR